MLFYYQNHFNSQILGFEILDLSFVNCKALQFTKFTLQSGSRDFPRERPMDPPPQGSDFSAVNFAKFRGTAVKIFENSAVKIFYNFRDFHHNLYVKIVIEYIYYQKVNLV